MTFSSKFREEVCLTSQHPFSQSMYFSKAHTDHISNTVHQRRNFYSSCLQQVSPANSSACCWTADGVLYPILTTQVLGRLQQRQRCLSIASAGECWPVWCLLEPRRFCWKSLRHLTYQPPALRYQPPTLLYSHPFYCIYTASLSISQYKQPRHCIITFNRFCLSA